MDELAAKMSKAISASKQKSVIVFDFSGPGDKPTALGQTLADQFSAALEKAARKFTVQDRAQARLPENRSGDPGASDNEFEVARATGAKALVTGRMVVAGVDLRLLVECYRLKDKKRIDGFSVAFPVTDTLRELSEGILDTRIPSTYPEAGRDGYSMPACLVCPRAEYSKEALNAKYSGYVGLVVLVDVHGRAKQFEVTKAGEYGLTEKAIESVEKWQFKPATGPDGKPAEVRVAIEVDFHLYNKR